MKLICSRKKLLEGINAVSKAVAMRSTMPVLDGILLTADKKLTLIGYNMETGIEYSMSAEILKTGTLVIPTRVFTEIVRRLPEEDVYLEAEEHDMLKVTSGASNFSIRGIPGAEYPKLPLVEHERSLSVSQKILKSMINETKFAASTDDSRPILKGINVISEEGTLTLVTIDGFRLVVRKETVTDEKQENMNFIVPASVMEDVAQILGDTDDKVNVGLSSNSILFDMDGIKIVSRLIQGEFLSYKNVITDGIRSSLLLAPQKLLAAIERASIVISREDKRFPVTIETSDENTLIISSKTDIGEAREEIDIKLEGEFLDIDFNPKLFMDALKGIDDEQVKLSFQGSIGPCTIEPVEGESFFYLVLPLRR